MSQVPLPREIRQFYAFDKMCAGCRPGGSRDFVETWPKMEALEKHRTFPWHLLNGMGRDRLGFSHTVGSHITMAHSRNWSVGEKWGNSIELTAVAPDSS